MSTGITSTFNYVMSTFDDDVTNKFIDIMSTINLKTKENL